MAKIKITIEVADQLEAYKAANKLALHNEVKEVETEDEIWVFADNSKVKYLFKRNFQDESGAQVTIK